MTQTGANLLTFSPPDRCDAWNRLLAEPGRIVTLTNYAYQQSAGLHEPGIILDDFCCVVRDRAETSALFKRIAARFERCSLVINANQSLGE